MSFEQWAEKETERLRARQAPVQPLPVAVPLPDKKKCGHCGGDGKEMIEVNCHGGKHQEVWGWCSVCDGEGFVLTEANP